MFANGSSGFNDASIVGLTSIFSLLISFAVNKEMTESADARIRYLEQVTQQLHQQVKLMKQLVATEVADLKGVMQQQVAEIKQIVMHQDRVYQERIRRLESRVEQLSEFSMQIARTTGTVGQASTLPLDILAVSPGGAVGQGSPSRSIVQAADDDDDDKIAGIPGVIQKYKDKIEAIYDYYTTSNIHVFHPAMTLSHFTRLLKDCKLCGFEAGEPAELLWMSVLRKLNVEQSKKKLGGTNAKATSVRSGKFSSSKRDNFAFERLEEIPKEYFGSALAILAQEKVGRQRADLSPEALFETFLVCEILPHVELKMDSSRGQPAMLAREVVGSASVQHYKTEDVKSLIKEYMPRLKETFLASLRSVQDYRDTTLNLDGFVEFARTSDLLPLISKPDLRQIFMACAAVEKSHHPETKEDTISMSSFVLALYHLADRIYGTSLLADKYPTPEARVQKLLSKVYLLK